MRFITIFLSLFAHVGAATGPLKVDVLELDGGCTVQIFSQPMEIDGQRFWIKAEMSNEYAYRKYARDENISYKNGVSRFLSFDNTKDAVHRRLHELILSNILKLPAPSEKPQEVAAPAATHPPKRPIGFLQARLPASKKPTTIPITITPQIDRIIFFWEDIMRDIRLFVSGSLDLSTLKVYYAKLPINADPLGIGKTDGEDPIDYIMRYLYKVGLKLTGYPDGIRKLLEYDNHRGDNGIDQLGVNNFEEQQKMVRSMLKVATDLRALRSIARPGIGAHGLPYLIYVTDKEDFTFWNIKKEELPLTVADYTVHDYFRLYSSVLGYVGFDPGDGNYTRQFGINTTLANIMRDKPVKIAMLMTEFGAVIAKDLNPKATELHIDRALPPMVALLEKSLPAGKYKKIGTSFEIPLQVLRDSWNARAGQDGVSV